MGLEQRVDTLEHKQEQTSEQLVRIEGKLDEHDKRFNRIDKNHNEFVKETRERFDEHDKRFDGIDQRLDRMQEFNQQTQDMVRIIYFAVKHEKPPE